MGTSSSVPLVELTDKEKKKCVPIPLGSPPDKALKGLRKLGVEVVSAEYVVHVQADDGKRIDGKNKKKGDRGGKTRRGGNKPPPEANQAALAASVMAMASASASASAASAIDSSAQQEDGGPLVGRVNRTAILTRGTLHLEVKKRFRKKKDPRPDVLFAVRDLQTVRCCAGGSSGGGGGGSSGSNNHLVVLAAWNSRGDLDFAMYQTPNPERLLRRLAEILAAGHAGVPSWAVPVRWNVVGLNLPRVLTDHATLLGSDGGFSSSFHSAALATLIRSGEAAVVGPLSKGGPPRISAAIERQQPPRPFVSNIPSGPKCLDAVELAEALLAGDGGGGGGASRSSAGSGRSVRSSLVLDALSCLPFNLVFRTLSIRNLRLDGADETFPSRFGRDLSRVFLYNVTLREIDLSGTNLSGLGETLGEGLAMNIQPLISRLDVSNSRLSDRDLRGLIPGLARLWCGGSAWPEYINFADNPSVVPPSWDVLFDALADPSTFPFWPNAAVPPPPPNLAYLQSLDLRGTTAARAPGLARLMRRLSGLRSFGVGSRGGGNAKGREGAAEAGGMNDLVLRALAESDAPLESFHGEGMDVSCIPALFRHSNTLRSVTLVDYRGDAGPLLGSWPVPVPKLSVEFKGKCDGAHVHVPKGGGYAPSTLELRSIAIIGQAARLLSLRATGLTSLYLYGVNYADLADAVPLLSCSGLVNLHVYPRRKEEGKGKGGGGGRYSTPPPPRDVTPSFWDALSTSKTLEDLQIPGQLTRNGELSMIGNFLKVNRSVRRINFDGDGFSLDVEGVKALRSAFYGNKKVIHMKPLDASRARTVEESRRVTQEQLREVQRCKAEIKRIFKLHYSKYNFNWRDKPNRLKLPYVERIRQAKRKIGQIERDTAKMAKLLGEIRGCIESNRRSYYQIQQEKESAKLERRRGQLENISQKKKKVMTQLVTKLHKAKQRGRKGKSGKTQVPRSAYYKDKRLWPSRNAGGGGGGGTGGRTRGAPSSHYHHWNDPYGARYHWGYGYYGYGYHDHRHHWLHDDCPDLDRYPPVPEEEVPSPPPSEDEEDQPGEDSERENPDDGGGADGGGADGGGADGGAPEGEEGPPPSFIVDNDVPWEDVPEDIAVDDDTNAWEDIAPVGDPAELAVPPDPWEGMDGLVREIDANPAVTLAPEFLADVHMEAAELGPDVVADLAPVLDAGAAVDAKIDDVVDSMAVDRDLVFNAVYSNLDEDFDVGAIESELGEIPAYEAVTDDFDEAETDDLQTDDVDDVVEMYAGAGPRDLDDGGPAFGSAGNAALAGARRRARTRKSNRMQQRVRSSVASRCSVGYKSLSFPKVAPRREDRTGSLSASWHGNLAGTLMQDVTAAQIDTISKSDFFTLPDVANSQVERILEWTKSSYSDLVSQVPIEVILVTQCSLDRLPNLQEQLVAWKGKASIAVYARHDASMVDAKRDIASHISEAKRRALESDGGAPHWDVALTVMQDTSDDAPYPINFLRNSALLEARYQQLQTRGTSDRAAALLVDVDFRPSNNLHGSLHCDAAADVIFEGRNVVVCPAFECASNLNGKAWPRTISQLKQCIDDDQAEGFHLSHFPQGHGPTRFDFFWKRSLAAPSADGIWDKAYYVPHEKCFEPYVVMAIDNVPFADERFQGYGLNKVSHLASVARQAPRGFLVLPGVFLCAPVHERSESWSEVYDSTSDEAKFNKLVLKGLYKNFCLRLEEGRDPMVSVRTTKMNAEVANEVKNSTRMIEREKQINQSEKLVAACSNDEKLLLTMLSSLLEQQLAPPTDELAVLGDSCNEESIKVSNKICLVQS